jgi:AcrR family transcriptional regulator
MAQQRSEETRTRILDSALKKFALTGYDGASVDDICVDAGISKGAFYHHFKTKNAVFLALMEIWLKSIDFGLKSSRHETVPETLVHMTNLLPGIFASAEDRLPMFLEFWLQASRNQEVWNAVIAPYHHYQDYFTELVKAGISEESFKKVDPTVAAQVIVSLAVGLFLQGILDPHGADWEKTAQESMKILMTGLAK